jgi:membrane fusion protein, multidrug efflux system
MSNDSTNSGPAAAREEKPGGGGAGGPASSHRRVRRRSLVIVALAAIGLLGAVWWLNHARGGAGMSVRQNIRAMFGPGAAVPVVAQQAEKGDIDIYKDGLGTVTPLATVTVITRISGELTEVHFKEGQEVKAGDLLAVIDPRPYQVALEQAQGQLLQAQAQLAQARSDLVRYETLSKQDSIAAQQVDTQRALVNQYEALVKTDQAAVDSARLNLVYCHITAPITGRVGLRQVDAGNYVTPSDTTGLVTLTQMRPISVIFTLPEDDYSAVGARLRAGAKIPVEAYDSTETQKLATGALAAIDNQADTSTGTFKLRATFSNENEALFPNEFVNVRMLLDVERGVIVIPTSAIELGQMGSYVYIVKPDDTVTPQAVVLGPTQGERVAVVKGLAAGDRVVVDGADRLREGARVVVQTPGQTQAGGPAAGAGPPGAATGRSKPAGQSQNGKGRRKRWSHASS